MGQSVIIAEKAFSKIRNVIVQNKLDVKVAFRGFDQDGDNEITSEELF